MKGNDKQGNMDKDGDDDEDSPCHQGRDDSRSMMVVTMMDKQGNMDEDGDDDEDLPCQSGQG